MLLNLKIREAKLKNSKIIYKIRNQKTSLKFFNFIKYFEHKKFFIENFKNKKDLFYLVLYKKKIIGYAKFKEINKNISDLSYHVAQNFQKKGYGAKVLKLATHKFFEQNKRKKQITAKVFKNNIGSIKCFTRSGYEKKINSKFIYFKFKKANLNKKNISILIQGPEGLEMLKNLKKKKLKANSIIVHKNSSSSYIREVRKTKVAKKVFISGKKFSKKILDHFKQNISLILNFFWKDIISPNIIESIDYGVINPHAGLLPYERGVHSYVYSILRNNPKGLTLHIMDKNKIDGGLILKQKKIRVKDFISGAELEVFQKKELVKFFAKNLKYIYKLNFLKKKFKIIDTKNHKQNFRKNLDKNTLLKLNKTYKARDLLNIMISRSGFEKGGAHFVFKKKKYEIDIKIKKKND